MKRLATHPTHRPATVQALEWPRLGHGAVLRDPADPAESTDLDAVVMSLHNALEQRDLHTARHSERLGIMGVAIGLALQLPKPELLLLYRGGCLHDIGKIGMPDSVLFKPGQLTREEWLIMQSHPERGEQIVRPIKALRDTLPIIRSHHERWDGSGYPDRLAGENIPLLARVIQTADIYDALTRCRPYKPSLSPKQALDIMREETERGWRDPQTMATFLHIHDDVVEQLADLEGGGDRALADMRNSMRNLQGAIDQRQIAAADEAPTPAA